MITVCKQEESVSLLGETKKVFRVTGMWRDIATDCGDTGFTLKSPMGDFLESIPAFNDYDVEEAWGDILLVAFSSERGALLPDEEIEKRLREIFSHS